MNDYIKIDLTKENHSTGSFQSVISRQQEDNCTILQILLSDEMAQKNIYIDWEKPDGKKYKTEKLAVVDNIVEYKIGDNLTDLAGTYKFDIVISSNDYVWKTFTKNLKVKQSINATQYIVENNPDWVTSTDNKIESIINSIGDLHRLDTNNKSDLVSAINEANRNGTGSGEGIVLNPYVFKFTENTWIFDSEYTITITNKEHKQGDDKTILVDVYALIDNSYQRINAFRISENGTVTLYSDIAYDGFVVIRSSSFYVGNNSGGKVDDVIVDGVSVVSDKIAKIDLRQTVIDILIEYGLIKLEELTTEQIEAIQNMTAEINDNGELILNYDTSVLDFDFEIVNKELIVKTGLNVDFNINNNKELEVTY